MAEDVSAKCKKTSFADSGNKSSTGNGKSRLINYLNYFQFFCYILNIPLRLLVFKFYLYVNRGRHEEEIRRWEEEEYYRRVEEERFWEEERHRRYEAEFFEWGPPGRMGPPRGPPGPMGPRPLMEGVGDMAPVRISAL